MNAMPYFSLLVVAMLFACSDNESQSAPVTTQRSATIEHCDLLTFEDIEKATGTKAKSSEKSRFGAGCNWIYSGEMLGQPADLVLVSLNISPQSYPVPETFEQFKADFESYWGQPWDNMQAINGLGKYAWFDGQVLQVITEKNVLISLTIDRNVSTDINVGRQLAEIALENYTQ